MNVYIYIFAEAFNESAAKGKQMVIGGTKSKASSQSGYFETNFSRILQVKDTFFCVCLPSGNHCYHFFKRKALKPTLSHMW